MGVAVERAPGIVTKVVDRIKRRKGERGLKVKGISDMLVRFANCCHPLPGEHVVGFITRGRGITIHNRNCRHIRSANPERLVEISWDTSPEDLYLADIRVTSVERKGILADVSAIITQKDANIVQAQVKTTSDSKGIALFTVEVATYKQLQEIIDAIKKVKNVLIVERL
jgi:GTP pyrophosphokinase